MNNKIIQILVPIVAVVVIFESIVLVSNLEKNTSSVIVGDVTPTITVTQEKIKAFDLAFSTDETQMKIGKKYKIEVNLTAEDNYNLNALDLYVRYNPELMTVSNLVSSNNLSTPDLIKVSDKKNVIALNYLFVEKDGVAFTKGKKETILTFTVTPKVTGSSVFEISTGDNDGDSVTMFVDKTTSESLNFSSNRLEVQFIK